MRVDLVAELERATDTTRSDRDVAADLDRVGEAGLGSEDSAVTAAFARVFRAVADNSGWTLAPLAAARSFDRLVRVPRALDAYRSGAPIADIESEFGISRTAIYELAREHRVRADRPRTGRRRSANRSAIRLGAFLGAAPSAIAAAEECSVRTVQRVLRDPVVEFQPWVDEVALADGGEPLRGAWNRLIDQLADDSVDIGLIGEPEWPTDRSRRALVAAGLAYRVAESGHELPAWLLSPNLVAAELTAPIPAHIPIVWPLTPPVVAHYNVAADASSFESV